MSENSSNKNINKNVGKFTNTVGKQRVEKKETPVDLGTVKESTGVKINFEKFEHKPKAGEQRLSNFQQSINAKLEKPKNLLIIYCIYGAAYLIIIGLCILFLFLLGDARNVYSPLQSMTLYKNFNNLSWYFYIIALSVLGLPIVVVLISWIIGINGVLRSFKYHVLIILVLAVSLLLTLCAITMTSIYMIEVYSFNPLPKPETDEGTDTGTEGEASTAAFLRLIFNI